MGVLDGVKVVELAEHGFVPSCAAVLADWGADVVKIERPGGDPLRSIMGAGLVADTGDFNFLFELYNRNKRGIVLDLRVPEGRDVFDRLIEQADVSRHELPAVGADEAARRPRRRVGGEPAAGLREGSRPGPARPRRGPRRLRRGVVLGARRYRPHPHARRRPDDHAARRDGRRAERRHARGRRRRRALPAGADGEGIRRRRRAARHRGLAARRRPDRHHRPARGAPQAARQQPAPEPARRSLHDGRRPVAPAQHARRHPALGADLRRARARRAGRRRALRRHGGPGREPRRSCTTGSRSGSVRCRWPS